MLIQDFIQVPVPFTALDLPPGAEFHTLLAENMAEAYNEGERLYLKIGPSPVLPALGKRVQLDLGMPFSRGAGTVFPVHWHADGAMNLFPRLEGDLEFMPLAGVLTQVTLSGSYTTPLGRAGQELDRILLHHVAEACIRSFLVRIANLLEQLQTLEPLAQQTKRQAVRPFPSRRDIN